MQHSGFVCFPSILFFFFCVVSSCELFEYQLSFNWVISFASVARKKKCTLLWLRLAMQIFHYDVVHTESEMIFLNDCRNSYGFTLRSVFQTHLIFVIRIGAFCRTKLLQSITTTATLSFPKFSFHALRVCLPQPRKKKKLEKIS